jgi:Tol biopolymer transport system component
MRPPRLLRRLLAAAAAAATLAAYAALVPADPAAAADPRPAVLVSRFGSTAVAEPASRSTDRVTPQGLSGDGRYAVFTTQSGPSTDDNGVTDVYLRDRRTGTTEAISVTSGGRAGNGGGFSPSISGDGRYVAFASSSDDLAGEVPRGTSNVFVRDRRTGTTSWVNHHPDGTRVGSVFETQISADGRAVLWLGYEGVFTRRLPDGPIRVIAFGSGWIASLSGDGSYAAYARTDGSVPVRRVRLSDGAIDVVSTTPAGVARGGFDPKISASGQVVSFTSDARDLRPGANGDHDLYVRDLSPGGSYFRLVDAWIHNHVMSGDGLTYAFTTGNQLLPEDTDAAIDVYATGPFGGLQLLSADLAPSLPDFSTGRGHWYPELSADGLVATSVSSATAGTGSTVSAPRIFAVAVQPAAAGEAVVASWFPRLFGRPMTTTEANARRGQLFSLSRTSAEVVVDDMRRESFSGPRAGVVRLYQAYFLRAPDTAGYDYWVGRRRAGVSLSEISRAFAASPEFRTLYGSLTDPEFVDRVYLNVLGRAGDATGVTYWTGQLASGARNRGEVMTGFSESPEYRATTSLQVETIMLFRASRGSVPSSAYLAQTEQRRRVGLGITTELTFIAGA